MRDVTPALPSADLLRQQAGWLAPARARLLRRGSIARRRRVLDLGAGHGAVTGELIRRSGGPVVALDLACDALRVSAAAFVGAGRVCADATRLPFADGEFDLVFCQCALLWMPAARTIDEVWRVLLPGGVLVALEPDYGGAIEHPPDVAARDVWIAALARAGADPLVGRKLPGLLESRGFSVRVDLLPELLPPEPARFDLLRGLPLTGDERATLKRIEENDASSSGMWTHVAHVPFLLVTATKPTEDDRG
ncbi:MAG TPA: class I SAM-dependent methyltransferase [Anaerolineae bacterium]|nr:class I SAM-dependent methyltransferase [Anaerolineae bacterium]